MVMEKVKKIKEAESKAEEIIKNAEKEAQRIINSIGEKEEELRREKEEWLKKEIERYKERRMIEKGEEFVIIFPNTTKENAKKVCETLNKKIKEYKFPNEKNQPNGDLTVSFGVASFPEDAATPQQLIEKADLALYKAKSTGRDKVITV